MYTHIHIDLRLSARHKPSRSLLSSLGFTGTNQVPLVGRSRLESFQSTTPKWMDVHKGLKRMHLLCATHTPAPLGALSAQIPTAFL